MKFNKDCVRDILLKCEVLLILNDDGEMNYVRSEELHANLPDYSLAEIKYTVKKMKEAGLLEVIVINDDISSLVDFLIEDITINGHEFIENIRNDNNWNKVKGIAKNVGAASLEVLSDISKQVISQAILHNVGM